MNVEHNAILIDNKQRYTCTDRVTRRCQVRNHNLLPSTCGNIACVLRIIKLRVYLNVLSRPPCLNRLDKCCVRGRLRTRVTEKKKKKKGVTLDRTFDRLDGKKKFFFFGEKRTRLEVMHSARRRRMLCYSDR